MSLPAGGFFETENPAEILRNEEGVFEVTSPYGHVFQVTCRRGSKMVISEISQPKFAKTPEGPAWQIRRVNRAVA